MNEELQKALAELLGKTNSGINTAGEFLASELPEVIQQLLMWHGVKSFLLFLSSLFIFGLWCWVQKKWNCTILEWQNESSEPVFFAFIWNVVPFMFVLGLANIQWLQIWIAPKVWLIEYAAKLAN